MVRDRTAGGQPPGLYVTLRVLRPRFILALLALSGALSVSGRVDAQDEAAPIFGERSLHLIHVPFLDFGPADSASPPPGAVRWTSETAYASTFSSTWHAPTFHRDFGRAGEPFTPAEAEAIHEAFPDDAVFLLEGDLLRESVTARAGLTSELSVSAELVYVSHGAIHGGSAIESFHHTFGFRDSGRSEFPADAFYSVIQKPGGPMVFDDRVPEAGLGDTTATLSWRPATGGRFRYGVDAAVKAATGSARDFNGSGSWDAGFLGFARREGSRWTLDLEAGEVFPGKWKNAADLRTAPFASALVAVTRRFGERTFVGASSTVEQSPFHRENMGSLSGPGWELALGVEHRFSRWSAGLTVTENTPYWKFRSDVGLALRVRVW